MTVEETVEVEETIEPAGEEETSSPEEEVQEEEASEETREDEDKTVAGLKAAAAAERKKRQAIEQELAELKAKEKPVEQPKSQESIEDMYSRDPVGTVKLINEEIARLAEEDPYSNAAQIEGLRDLKIDLKETGKTKAREKVDSFTKQVNEMIPDFSAKQNELTNFAIENLGYTQADLAAVTNFNVVGEKAALATIKLINQQYDLVNGKTPVKKVTQAPEPIKPLSTGKSAPTGEPDAEKNPEAWLAWERERKRKAGKLY